MKLINIGFGNLVSDARLIAIASPESLPIKRIIQDSKERGTLIDASFGRKTRAVLVMDSDHVILSALQPEKIAARAVESIGQFYDIPMELDGTIDTLLRISDEAGVSQCLIHGVAVDALHVRHINDFVIAAVQAHPDRLMGFASLHPDMEDPGKELDRVLRAGLCGVKLHPDMQKFSLGETRTDRLFSVCEGVCPMLFHTGDKRYQYSNPTLIPPILKKHPHLSLICAHFGGYSEWDEAAKCLADENVYVDSSSSFFMGFPKGKLYRTIPYVQPHSDFCHLQ